MTHEEMRQHREHMRALCLIAAAQLVAGHRFATTRGEMQDMAADFYQWVQTGKRTESNAS